MDWENFRYFIVLAHNKSLKSASEALQVSHTTVYRRLKAFQDDLGIQLFELVSNRYRLTPVGLQLLEKLKSVEQELVQIARELEGLDARVSGRVVISTTASFAYMVFPKLVSGLYNSFPELSVEVKASDDVLSMSQREADIAVRITNDPPESLIGRKVGPVKHALYASRSYLKRHPYLVD